MSDLLHATRARLRRIGQRLGALPAMAVILLLIGPVWIGYCATLGLLEDHAYILEPEDATATIGDYLYFSLMTMLTLDNGKIQPLSREAKLVETDAPRAERAGGT